MAKRRKRKIVFGLRNRPGRKFRVGTVFRFTWPDLYRALQIINEEVQDAELKLKLVALLGSSREMIHTHLWEVIQALEYDECVLKDRVQAAGWIVACYGYVRGLEVLSDDGSSKKFPLPRPLKRIPKSRFRDFREELKCPVCLKPFVPPKRYKTKNVILKWFAGKISSHLELECGGQRNV